MQTKKFKCKDEVIYRRTDEKDEWTYGIFSHYYDYNNVKGVVVDGHFLLSTVHNILPYEGNEHLVGTTDSPDEEVRLEEGERIIPFNDEEDFERINRLSSSFFHEIRDCYFMVDKCAIRPEGVPFEFCIRFKDIRFNDMEETKKHILCVKNGKIVRYRKNG